MNYEIDSLGRVWLNDGIIIENCGRAWDEYQAWIAEGNTPSQRNEETD